MGQMFIWAGVAALLTLQCGSAYKLVCYFSNWAQYRTGEGRFVPDNIDPNLCTHLIYSFANISNNKITTYEWNDVTLYGTFNSLKDRNPRLKTLLSVGGYAIGSKPFISVVSSPATRWVFLQSVVKFLRTYKFDGLDLNWIYPTENEKSLFTKLVKDLAGGFQNEAKTTGQEKLILSVSVAAGRQTVDKGYEVGQISQAVDFLSLMAYDFHGSWEKVTGHISPLQQSRSDSGSSSYYNVDYAVKYWKIKGTPAEKIILGIPTYGRTFTLSTTQNGVGAPASGAGTAGPFTQEAGLLAYYEICSFKQGATTERIEEQLVPYSYKGNQWVGYDDEESIKHKVQYLKTNNLGGAMIWALDLDDFAGSFCSRKEPYPLVRAVKAVLNAKKR